MRDVRIAMLGEFAVAVDGVTVDPSHWSRRHAATLLKVLALAPGRRLHREQVLDAVWPDDRIDQSVPKLHKAAHYARKALGFADGLVLRGEQVMLAPESHVSIDVVAFESAARSALSSDDVVAAREAIELYSGELLPADLYDDWAVVPREQLRLLYLDLLRLDHRWDDVLQLEPSDEVAHVHLMRRYAAAGDRHAALRQFERLDKVLRRELGVAPSRDAVELRDRLLDDATPIPMSRGPLVGREAQLSVSLQAIADVAAGSSRTLILNGLAGSGKSSLLAAIGDEARARGLRTGSGGAASVEGAWPFAPVIDALADLCRRHPSLLDGLPDQHRLELDHALGGSEGVWEGASSHQRLFVAATELVRLAAGSRGVMLAIDDLHDGDDASLRLIHYIARSTQDDRVLLVLSHRPAPIPTVLAETRRSLLDRHGAQEIELTPLAAGDIEVLIGRHLRDAGPELIQQIAAASQGIPFAVDELAKRAATGPAWTAALDAFIVSGVPAATRDVLQRIAVVGATFDTDEFMAISLLNESEAFEHLDVALACAIVEPTGHGYRFRHGLIRDALLADVPPHRRRQVHRRAAEWLIATGSSSARIGHHLMESGATTEAVPYLLRAAETDASLGAYRDAAIIVDSVLPHATGDDRQSALLLKGDLLNAIGDPLAAAAYREALSGAEGTTARMLRARLARAAVMAGDLDTARAALNGLETVGDAADSDILLAQGNVAFFTNDITMAEQAVAQAQHLILTGQRDWKILDLVALQGLLAHLSGNWFDRMTIELRRTRDNPEVANAIFDGHLCAAEFLLYGPTPYLDVISVGRDLKRTAQRSGALRAAAFAAALIGEAALLAGNIDLAEAELMEARELHHDLGSAAGEAHSLQRLGELHLARGDNTRATELLQRAVPLARASMVANHLLQRIYGTLIIAAPDPIHARAMVDRAESVLGWDEVCPFCTVMLSVPATIACARAGDVDHARQHLAKAELSAALWQGTSWEAALAEARAAIATASGDQHAASQLLADALDLFSTAGQPLDVARCRRALAAV
jgi:DNA-binding SARP family transcriptional activator/tetratricopeptide (TPR) repeat protein